MSKFIPNSYQTPNVIVDEMISVLTDTEFKIYHLILRNTVGWQKHKSKTLTIANMTELLNKSKPTIVKATKGLRELNLIQEHGSKRTGFSYSINFEITGERVEQKWFRNSDDALNQWLKNLTIKERAEKFNGKNILPLMVKYFNHPYILNTDFKHNYKKYIKKIEPKNDLKSKTTFEKFKVKFEFINFSDYLRLVDHLEKLNASVTKKRISNNLNKCKNKKIDAEKFKKVIDDFVGQVKYQGIFISFDNNAQKRSTPQTASEKLRAAKEAMRSNVSNDTNIIDTEVA